MNKSTYLLVFLVVVILIVAFVAYNSSKDEGVTTPVDGPATVSTLSVAYDTSSASAISAGSKTVSWQTNNYPSDAGVNINLIRKVSDSPAQFALVRALATDTANDGREVWTPAAGENTSDLYIEVTCSNSFQFAEGCSLTNEPIKVN